MMMVFIIILISFTVKGSNTNSNNISFILNEEQQVNNDNECKSKDFSYLMRLIQHLYNENNKTKEEIAATTKILLPIYCESNNLSNEVKMLIVENYKRFQCIENLKNQMKDLQDTVSFLNNRINTLQEEKETKISPITHKKRKNNNDLIIVESPKKRKKNNENFRKNN